MPRQIQASFSGGEVSPGLYGRVDLAKYNTSLATCLNSFVHAHGGVSNRPGTEFIAESVGITTRFIPFQFSVVQGYILEFGERVMRVLINGGLVVHTESTTSAWATATAYKVNGYVNNDSVIYRCIANHTSAAASEPGVGAIWETYWVADDVLRVTTPFHDEDLQGLKFTQSADVLYFGHGDYNAWTLTRSAHTEWTFTKVDFQPQIQPPIGLAGTYDGTGSFNVEYKVSAVSETGEESLPSGAVTVHADPSNNWEAGKMVTLTWGSGYTADVLTGGSVSSTSGTAANSVDNNVNTYCQFDSGGGSVTYDLGSGVTKTPAKLRIYNKVITNRTAVLGSYLNDTAAITKDFILYGSNNGTTWTSLLSGQCPAGAAWYDFMVSTSTAFRYLRLAVSTSWEKYGLVSPGIAEWQVREVSATDTDQDVQIASYNVYKNANGYFGYIGSTDGSETTTFYDNNIEADIGSGPRQPFAGFVGANAHPKVPTFFQQRLIYGGTDDQPQTVFASQTGLFNNFSVSSPLKDTDAIEATIAATQVNEIRHFVPLNKLIVFTSGGEWAMSAGQNSDAITPTNINFDIQGYRGCSNVPPLVIGQTVLFVQRGGSKVRDLAYQLTSDAYTGSDLTVLADHLFKNRSITSWAYQQDPDSVIWCVRDDGVMLGFTYLKEHEVWAWHRHETDGEVLDVAVLEGDSEDEVYINVKRTIDDVDKYYIEKLAIRLEDDDIVKAWFVDCGYRYEGDATTVVTGLEFIEGKTVAVIADGSLQPRTVVVNGQITIAEAASTILVGIPFVSEIKTLRVDINDAQTWQGATKTIPSVTLRFWNSLGGLCGPDEDHLTPVYSPIPDVFGESPALRTEDYQMMLFSAWNTRGDIIFRQEDPLPFTLLAIIPEVEVGG